MSKATVYCVRTEHVLTCMSHLCIEAIQNSAIVVCTIRSKKQYHETLLLKFFLYEWPSEREIHTKVVQIAETKENKMLYSIFVAIN